MRQARSAPRGRPAAPSWGVTCLLLAVASVAACRVDLPQVECANALDCPSGQRCARGVCVARGDTGAGDLVPDGAADATDTALDSASDDTAADTAIDTASGDADTAVADVDLGQTIYVDPDGGDDANNGTAAAPVASPDRALELLQSDRDTILLARGSYNVDGPLVFEDLEALQLSGGHRPEASWGRIGSSRSILVGDGPILVFRDVGSAQLTQIGAVTSSGTDGADGQPGTATGPLETVTPVEARSGQTAVAVIAERSSIWLVQCSVEVGDGGEGGTGRVGRDGADGNPGGRGDDGCTSCEEPLGGEGGAAPACLLGETGAMLGGNGGNGADLDDGQNPGESGGGGEGGKGGLVGDNESVDGLDPHPASGGSHGIAGGPLGYFRDGRWHPVAGSPGQPGENGHGGGGGAGGAASAEDVRGAGGGGGGSGGCGGEGGGGGGGGGGSVAVLLIDSDLRVDRSELQTGRGGAGGDGGAGGAGGDAGPGGDPGTMVSAGSGEVGAGGDGSGGGDGGRGGGGGGGISVAVLRVGDSDVTLDEATTVLVGPGGSGGRGADNSLDYTGATGLSATELAFAGATDLDADCPLGSVSVEAGAARFCADLYESALASTLPESATNPEQGGIQAASVPGGTPWTEVDFATASTACRHAAKTLCAGDALAALCTEASLEPAACNFGSAVQPTGFYASCTTADGLVDLLGNVAEWVTDPADPMRPAGVHGGSHQTSTEEASCSLIESLPADTQSPAVGFRCCGQAKLFQQSEYAQPD